MADEESAVRFLLRKYSEVGGFMRLRHFLTDHPEVGLSGRITRTSHHYVHEHSTSLDLESNAAGDPMVPQFSEFESAIQELNYDINRQIYEDLEKEYEYQTSDEAVVESLNDNDVRFDEDGGVVRGGGAGKLIDELEPHARQRALEHGRDWNVEDEYWCESVLGDWKQILEQIGFADPDISYSGFWSQGDGASFTCQSIDVDKLFKYIGRYGWKVPDLSKML